MSIFKKMKAAAAEATIEKTTDNLGASSGPFDSNAYDFLVKKAYIDYSQGGAMSVNLEFEQLGTKKVLRSQQWVTSGDAKGNLNYYVNKNTGKNHYLPGYVIVNDIATIITGQPLEDQEAEEKGVKVYDFEAKKDVTQEKMVLIDLIGQEIKLGVLKVIEDKKAKDDSGEYAPTGETREVNEIDKVFDVETGRTLQEIKADVEEGEFVNRWVERNKDNVRNKAKGAGNVKKGAPTSGRPSPAADGDAPKKRKLFG